MKRIVTAAVLSVFAATAHAEQARLRCVANHADATLYDVYIDEVGDEINNRLVVNATDDDHVEYSCAKVRDAFYTECQYFDGEQIHIASLYLSPIFKENNRIVTFSASLIEGATPVREDRNVTCVNVSDFQSEEGQ